MLLGGEVDEALGAGHRPAARKASPRGPPWPAPVLSLRALAGKHQGRIAAQPRPRRRPERRRRNRPASAWTGRLRQLVGRPVGGRSNCGDCALATRRGNGPPEIAVIFYLLSPRIRRILAVRPSGWVNLYVAVDIKRQQAATCSLIGLPLRLGAGSTRAVRMVTNSSPAVGLNTHGGRRTGPWWPRLSRQPPGLGSAQPHRRPPCARPTTLSCRGPRRSAFMKVRCWRTRHGVLHRPERPRRRPLISPRVSLASSSVSPTLARLGLAEHGRRHVAVDRAWRGCLLPKLGIGEASGLP